MQVLEMGSTTRTEKSHLDDAGNNMTAAAQVSTHMANENFLIKRRRLTVRTLYLVQGSERLTRDG